MIKILQRRFALSEQGAVDLIKGCIACVAQDISFMIPVGLLYFLVIDMMNGGVSKNMSLSMPLVRWFAYALYLSRPGFNIMPLI